MKRIPKRLRVGQLVVAEWMDAATAGIVKGDRLLPARVKTVGWVWERTDEFITVHPEIFLSGHVQGDARDATTILAETLKSIRVLADVGET